MQLQDIYKQVDYNDRSQNRSEYPVCLFSFSLPDLTDHELVDAVYQKAMKDLCYRQKRSGRGDGRQCLGTNADTGDQGVNDCYYCDT